ncbi:hypothetical protein JCM9140_1124 [Halalkalibacter wakoensis JCM 9140]|uniref:Uncharacterized protein n=1 Tax=Halalkalibacter wakoensis JCM 9140 TaxID=1236970 RepID=W4PZI1_9BACI|nr:hypothetical protein [Halalkalibacter wakoensis]GAE25147.1 hypothetical protein JCM9140_1124 [Halalkalibacter wakoensis JCM 9140]
MDHQPLTYFEKLENVYVLIETRKMLQHKLTQLKEANQSTELVKEDLRKIEEEIEEYTDGAPVETNQTLTSSLFNPALINQLEDIRDPE